MFKMSAPLPTSVHRSRRSSPRESPHPREPYHTGGSDAAISKLQTTQIGKTTCFLNYLANDTQQRPLPGSAESDVVIIGASIIRTGTLIELNSQIGMGRPLIEKLLTPAPYRRLGTIASRAAKPEGEGRDRRSKTNWEDPFPV